MNHLNWILTFPFLVMIRIYRFFISPLLASNCRFHPTCSGYAQQAIREHGVFGVYLSLKRLLKCHPWHNGGVDPVPPRTLTSNLCKDIHDA